ncbi:MAG: hypothetical protein D6E12_17905 [Desulfovibrio sp.]|nr:MAG: hypothetical protein D6E12_17905 [Desulfovibrio sp.]
MCLSLVLMLAYRFTWKALSKAKGAHITLGVVSALTVTAAIIYVLFLKRTLFLYPVAFTIDPSLATFFGSMPSIPLDSFFWPMLGQVTALAICSCGALGLLYLLARRQRDDFGRDYYAYAAKHFATWAVLAGVVQFPFQTWLYYTLIPILRTTSPMSDILVVSLGLAALMLALACVCWGWVRRGAAPLRKKPAIILGALFLLGGIACQGYCFGKLLF